jgi:mRNA interferase MazF
VWWGETPDAKGRPYLVITRDEAIPVLRTLVVAPVTRTIRGIRTEIELDDREGLPLRSVAAIDSLLTFPKAMLVRKMGAMAPTRHTDLCAALAAMADC